MSAGERYRVGDTRGGGHLLGLDCRPWHLRSLVGRRRIRTVLLRGLVALLVLEAWRDVYPRFGGLASLVSG